MYERQDLEEKLTEDIFVPSIFLVETPDKELVSMIVWPDGISQLFPECDFVFVERTKKKLFGERREMGLIPYNEVIATINPYLGNYSTTAGPVKYLPPSRKADIPSILQRLNLRPAKLSSYNRVSPDSFHDVELPTE